MSWFDEAAVAAEEDEGLLCAYQLICAVREVASLAVFNLV